MKNFSLLFACAGIILAATVAHAGLPQDGKKQAPAKTEVKTTPGEKPATGSEKKHLPSKPVKKAVLAKKASAESLKQK